MCDEHREALGREIRDVKRTSEKLEACQRRGVSWTIFWSILGLVFAAAMAAGGFLWGEVSQNRETATANAKTVTGLAAWKDAADQRAERAEQRAERMDSKLDRILDELRKN